MRPAPGATGAASASTGASIVSLTTTAPGSLVYGVGNDSARSTPRTLGANQTMTHQWLDNSGAQTFWVQSITRRSPTPARSRPSTTRADQRPVESRVGRDSGRQRRGAAGDGAERRRAEPGRDDGRARQRRPARRRDHVGIEHDSAGRCGDQSNAAGGHAGGERQRGRAGGLGRRARGRNAERRRARAVGGHVLDRRQRGLDDWLGQLPCRAPTVPAGAVDQPDAAGKVTQIPTGSVVALVVSSGLPKVAAPNVVGLTQAAATASIANAGLARPGDTGAEYVRSAGLGDQSEPGGRHAGQYRQRGRRSPCRLVRRWLRRPTSTASRRARRRARSPARAWRSVPSRPLRARRARGGVISQLPVAGTLVPWCSPVALTVSSGRRCRSTGPWSWRRRHARDTGLHDRRPSLNCRSRSCRPTARTPRRGRRRPFPRRSPWTLVRRANTQYGTAEIWNATAASQLVNATVMATQSVTNSYHMQLVVVAFRGAGGVAPRRRTATTTPRRRACPLTTTDAGSLVYGVGNDPERNQARTLGTGQRWRRQWLENTDRLTFWVQSRTAAVASAGTSVTINDTAPDFDRWNLAAVDLRLGSSAPCRGQSFRPSPISF